MKILILNYEYPPIGGGGGRLAAKVGAGLVRSGHQIRVLTAGMSHLPVESSEDGMEIHRLRACRRREDTCTVPEMALWIMTAIPTAIAEVRRWKPHVIHAHFAVPTGVVAWIVWRLTGVPYVLTAHLGDVPGGVPEQTGGLFRWIRPLTVPIWENAAAVTAVSNFVAGLAKDAYGISPKVILNGIVLPPISATEPGVPVRILMVGRLSVQKNPLCAVRALGLLKEFSWECVILGDGPLLQQARSEADRLGIAGRIDFRGWATSEVVTATMRQSDILIIPSLSEGLPMCAIEALGYGLAIVGSRIGGLADVVKEGSNGRLFDLAEGECGLASALRPLLLDPDLLRASRGASLAMASQFDLNHSLAGYETVLKEASR